MSDLTSKTVEELREMYLSPLSDKDELEIFDELARRLAAVTRQRDELATLMEPLMDELGRAEGIGAIAGLVCMNWLDAHRIKEALAKIKEGG